MNFVSKTYIIAEAGINHNGSLEMAKQLVDVAVEAGADAVKFQTFKTENVISLYAPKAEYQKQTTDASESQLEMAKNLELNYSAFETLSVYCDKQKIHFLSTPFDLESLSFLVNKVKVKQLKLPSGEITNALLLLEAAQSGLPIIMSTGMSTLSEIETALSVLAFGYTSTRESPSIERFQKSYFSSEGQLALKEEVTLLHCTTEYPAPFDEVNLRAMDTLRSAFELKVGFSDHSQGISAPLAAVARDAVLIEKHFTLDRNLIGPDHRASLEPGELKSMVEGIREVERSLGQSLKLPSPSEIKNKPIARKSLVANCEISKGESFSVSNLTVKRPGTGISPMHYWEWLGRRAERDFNKDELISTE